MGCGSSTVDLSKLGGGSAASRAVEAAIPKTGPVRVNQLLTWPSYVDLYGVEPHISTRAPVRLDLAHKIVVFQGDVSRVAADAIVSPANRDLIGGAPRTADGAIHAAAGPELKEASTKLAPLEEGEAVMTSGFKLPAKHVIHTVGPMNRNVESLQQCYRNSLQLAGKAKDIRTVAFPSIATGSNAFPHEAAIQVALRETRRYLEENPDEFDHVVFIMFDERAMIALRDGLLDWFPLESEGLAADEAALTAFVSTPGREFVNVKQWGGR